MNTRYKLFKKMHDISLLGMRDNFLPNGGCDSCCPTCKQWEHQGNLITSKDSPDGLVLRECSNCKYTWKAIFTPGGFIAVDDTETKEKTDLSWFNNTDLNLELLAEESAEIVHAKAKIFRFGLTEENLDRLNAEVGDILAIVDILVDTKVLDRDKLSKASRDKLAKLQTFYTFK